MLDYLQPADIAVFKFPNLLNTNFFNSDFFKMDAPFNSILSKDKMKFDFIIGNPPWKRGRNERIRYMFKYIADRRSKEKSDSTIGNKEIAQAFLLRSSDFAAANTKCSLIVTSKVLYNLQSSDFRKYFLDNFFIQRVFELAPVRREVFNKSNKKAIAPACVLFFSFAYSNNTDLNIIEHIALKPGRFFSLFKIFTINRTDYKKVQQSRLKEFDWLWKVLVYGSYMDFNYIKRLKEEFRSIREVISDDKKFLQGTGIQFSSTAEYDSKHLLDKPFVPAEAVNPFFIEPDQIVPFKMEKVHRLRNTKEQIFHAPVLLSRKGLDINRLNLKSAILYNDAVFKDTLTAVKSLSNDDLNVLKNIMALVTSDLYSYIAINTFASI
jgi:hypothetical protein